MLSIQTVEFMHEVLTSKRSFRWWKPNFLPAETSLPTSRYIHVLTHLFLIQKRHQKTA